MITSRIEFENGRAHLVIGEQRVPACAYITYYDERSRCDDFAKAGYRIFSLCASFSGLPLNSVTGFSPLFGIFDVEGKPDYSQFDANVRQIVKSCPDAKIFPRVRVSMPAWWNQRHPDDICCGPDGVAREALFSDAYRETGAEMLREFIAHIHASDYADHIIGYQIAGGSTEEWFHFDVNGSRSGCSKKKFNDYLQAHYPGEYTKEAALPDDALLTGTGAITDITVRRYLEFIGFSVAETVAHFAHVAKECVQHKQMVGAFFGYVQEVPEVKRGSVGLWPLLHCPDIDFYCSPASYVHMRALGGDWAEHCAGESMKQHGKLYFIENDIRTFLSDYPGNCRPGADPKGKYCSPLWLGPPTEKETVWAMRKAYARQLTHANAMWWFDMWGGWYATDALMQEAARCLSMVKELDASEAPATRSSIAVLFDEKYPFRVGSGDPCYKIQTALHNVIGSTGFTSDALLTEDYRESLHYQAVLLPFPAEFDSDETRTIKDFLRENGIPFVQLTTEDTAITADDLRSRLLQTGAHCYCTTGDVVYHGNGWLAVHAASPGKKEIRLPAPATIIPLDPPGGTFVSDVIEVDMEQFETKIFRTE